ncbi:hypothetical protein HDU76_004485 [Blyttiomyces sp. JEL0837]|nr:hypothetical protein HDU76_004485 [Blyttiomyces sp. JEL0837]
MPVSSTKSQPAPHIPLALPGSSFEDVAPYCTTKKAKNVVAILIDQSKQSEQAFESVLETVVPEYDPVDTQFILISGQIPTTPASTVNNYTHIQATRDFVAQRAEQLFKASFHDAPPSYAISETKPTKETKPMEPHNLDEPWYGHVRGIVYRGEKSQELVDKLPKLGITLIILATHQDSLPVTTSPPSLWQFSHNVNMLVLSGPLIPMKVVKGEVGSGGDLAEVRRLAYEEVSGRSWDDYKVGKKLFYFDRFMQGIAFGF